MISFGSVVDSNFSKIIGFLTVIIRWILLEQLGRKAKYFKSLENSKFIV